EAELQRRGDGRGGGPILHGAGRVRALELQAQPSYAQAGGQGGRLQQGRTALPEGQPMRGILDRQHRRVTPEAGPAERRWPVAAQASEIVDELQQAVALRALQDVVEREGGAAVDAGQVAGERGA